MRSMRGYNMFRQFEMARHKKGFLLMVAVFAATFVFAVIATAAGRPSHLDKTKNPSGCAGCHKGHGHRGTPMLSASTWEICFSCHGLTGSGRGVFTKSDMSSVFSKRYHHPVVETSMYHMQGEVLPEKSSATPRHVACQDCHSVHQTEPGDTMKGVMGHRKGRTADKVATEEYEVCYRCHSDSANLPINSKDISLEFDPSNVSYHPVEVAGRNKHMPSLTGGLNVSSRIKCTDCHGNDDPTGPKGPHGSSYEFMLSDEYIRTETAETPLSYSLCYKCHLRQSILGNQSFQKHKEHIVYQHIPCSACHNSHGSARYPDLIDFDRTFVGMGATGSYLPGMGGRPVCYLTCHVGGRDTQHDNAFYLSKKWL
jgi:predicted CXXCH cytochrome family protein